MKPYYEEGGITIYLGDAREGWEASFAPGDAAGCVIFDPPWDQEDLMELPLPDTESTLVFTDPRRLGQAVTYFGPPTWVFTWDTMSGWTTGPSRPVQQTKQCLWYGDIDRYHRDEVLWGEAPPERDHPTTKQVPLDGRRLTDLWRESLRWLHHPTAATGAAGTERFGTRQGESFMRHAKPLGWFRCLIGNTSDGLVFDPFMGTGTSLVAARDLGREAIGTDIDERACEYAASRLAQQTLNLEAA